MATRRNIKEAFYTELVTAVTGLVDANDVTLTQFDRSTTLPRVVYTDLYRHLPINGASGSPHKVNRDMNDVVTSEEFHEYEEAVFTITVKDSDENSLEPIYEAIHSYFGKYQFQPWDESEIHEDVFRVRIRDVRTTDDASSENTTRGDTLEVHIAFIRSYERVEENIESVQHDVEGEIYETN